MGNGMISIPVAKYNELADLVLELTGKHRALIADHERVVRELAEAQRDRQREHDLRCRLAGELEAVRARIAATKDDGPGTLADAASTRSMAAEARARGEECVDKCLIEYSDGTRDARCKAYPRCICGGPEGNPDG